MPCAPYRRCLSAVMAATAIGGMVPIAGAQPAAREVPRAWIGVQQGVGMVGSRGITYQGGAVHLPAVTLGGRIRRTIGAEVTGWVQRALLVNPREQDPRPYATDFDGVAGSVVFISRRNDRLSTSTVGIAALRPLGRSEVAAALLAGVQEDVIRLRAGAVTMGARAWYAPDLRETSMWSAGLTVGWRIH